jgi:hypothetical protein
VPTETYSSDRDPRFGLSQINWRKSGRLQVMLDGFRGLAAVPIAGRVAGTAVMSSLSLVAPERVGCHPDG